MKPPSNQPVDERALLRRAATETFLGKLMVELKQLETEVKKLGYERIKEDFQRQQEMSGLDASRIMANLKGVLGDVSEAHIYEHPLRAELEPSLDLDEDEIRTLERLLGQPLNES